MIKISLLYKTEFFFEIYPNVLIICTMTNNFGIISFSFDPGSSYTESSDDDNNTIISISSTSNNAIDLTDVDDIGSGIQEDLILIENTR